MLLELVEDLLDPVDGGEDERDRVLCHRHAVAELAHQRLGGMRQRFQARQAEKTAGSLDGVDQPENVVENLGVVRVLFEPDEFNVDHVEAFIRLGQKFPQQIVHGNSLSTAGRASPRLSGASESVGKGFKFS